MSVFNPEAQFDGIPLYEAHLIAVPSQSSPLSPRKNDSSETDTSTSGFTGFIESGFFSAACIWGSLTDL